jgi:hypothetical protein
MNKPLPKVKPEILIYRCKRCGAHDRSRHLPTTMSSLGVTIDEYEIELPRLALACLPDLHVCNTGELGVMELVGADLGPWKETPA